MTQPQVHALQNKPDSLGFARFRLGYRPELDGIRGVSILLVFVHHIYYSLLPGGFLGVDIFFVLSGFLITSLLLQEWDQNHSINLKHFYIRRTLRLTPALIVLVVALSIFAALFLNGLSAVKTYKGVLLALSYISNWLYAFDLASADNPLGITWSLAIEEQFYVLWPLALRFALKLGLTRRALVLILLGLILLIVGHRSFLPNEPEDIARIYYASDTRADALLVGCMVACLVSGNMVPKTRAFGLLLRCLTILSVIFLTLMAVFATWTDFLAYRSTTITLIALSAGSILTMMVVSPPTWVLWILRFSALVWIGRVSYGLYLWHWAVRWFVYQQEALPASQLQLWMTVFLSLALTSLSYYFVEKPFLNWKKRFSTRRTPHTP
jgi:peptidoglycan/LPS O-acetylase OafA/YrhL